MQNRIREIYPRYQSLSYKAKRDIKYIIMSIPDIRVFGIIPYTGYRRAFQHDRRNFIITPEKGSTFEDPTVGLILYRGRPYPILKVTPSGILLEINIKPIETDYIILSLLEALGVGLTRFGEGYVYDKSSEIGRNVIECREYYGVVRAIQRDVALSIAKEERQERGQKKVLPAFISDGIRRAAVALPAETAWLPSAITITGHPCAPFEAAKAINPYNARQKPMKNKFLESVQNSGKSGVSVSKMLKTGRLRR